MEKIALHLRISGVAISDDDVNSRRTAASSLAVRWGKYNSASKIVSLAAEIAEALGGTGNPSPTLGAEVQTAIQKKSSSYLFEERPLDVSVCAGMAMVSILNVSPNNGGWEVPDVYGTALWLALAYQPILETERREALRCEVLNIASERVMNAAEKARERRDVLDPLVVDIRIDEANAVTNNVNEAIIKTVDALRRNAALDREELDFLWWAQLGRSRLLDKQLSAIVEPTRIVAAAVEGATMLRRLPCEVHREIILRTLDQNQELDLTELLTAIGDDRIALCKTIPERNAAFPIVFPLLHALTTGEAKGSGAEVKRPISEWGERALLEAGFARMISQGIGRL